MDKSPTPQNQLLPEEQHQQLRRARAPLHVLVIDDDIVTRTLLQRLLGNKYCVSFCATIDHAITDYLQLVPDLVFLDLDLGDAEFNGFDVAHTLRLYDDQAHIVILSAHESPENIARATRAGVMGFMAKPFKASRILHYVQECERAKFNPGPASWN